MGMGLSIKRILVTGGCGFIGANFIRLELEVDPDIPTTSRTFPAIRGITSFTATLPTAQLS